MVCPFTDDSWRTCVVCSIADDSWRTCVVCSFADDSCMTCMVCPFCWWQLYDLYGLPHLLMTAEGPVWSALLLMTAAGPVWSVPFADDSWRASAWSAPFADDSCKICVVCSMLMTSRDSAVAWYNVYHSWRMCVVCPDADALSMDWSQLWYLNDLL